MKKIVTILTLVCFCFFSFTPQASAVRYEDFVEYLSDGWRLSISTDEHYIAGCVNRVVPHWGFAIKRGDNTPDYEEKINVHIARWEELENNRTCAAVYDSASQFCEKMCVSNDDPQGNSDLKIFAEQMVKNLLIGLGVASATACIFGEWVAWRAAGLFIIVDPYGFVIPEGSPL